eukprot:TRINITY_DN275_c0_g1_i3.p1 TRINITY_DN275_c0_g1~~TRINITY_DN275_c0_g1_i3.p1  ORF type:complete len:1138 (-),score=341.07 TRINITY_DN275_c0_g1_i3:213-3626(-)
MDSPETLNTVDVSLEVLSSDVASPSPLQPLEKKEKRTLMSRLRRKSRHHTAAVRPPTNFHIQSSEAIIAQLNVDPKRGLTNEEAALRLQQYGPNELTGKGGVSFWKILFGQIANAMTLVLIIALILSAVTKQFIEVIVIAIIILFNVTVGVTQEYHSESSMQALQSMSAPKATIIRNKEVASYDTKFVVPGDIIKIRDGDQIAADMRVLHATNLELDESMLTGESVPVSKNAHTREALDEPLGDRKNMLYKNTIVTQGKGKAVVVATGMQSEVGHIAEALAEAASAKPEKTDLQRRMDRMSIILFGVAILLGLLVLATEKFTMKETTLLYAISVGVSIIPEGLVAVLTVTMALGVRRMAKSNAIVRKLASLESLGSVSNICSDKTGTMTMGKMTVVEMWTGPEAAYKVSGAGLDPQGEISTDDGKVLPAGHYPPTMDLMLLNACLNNHATLAPKSEMEAAAEEAAAASGNKGKEPVHMHHDSNKDAANKDVKESWVGVGSPTEVALTVLAHKVGLVREELISGTGGWAVLEEYLFDSTIKRMSVVCVPQSSPLAAQAALNRSSALGRSGSILPPREMSRSSSMIRSSSLGQSTSSLSSMVRSASLTAFNSKFGPDTGILVLTKGAPERLLAICTKYVDESTSASSLSASLHEAPLTDEIRTRIHDANHNLAQHGLRVLGMAYRRIDEFVPTGEPAQRAEIESDLTFLGLVGIQDPPRPETAAAVAECQRAGIHIHMLTGDHEATATAISGQIGILPATAEHPDWMIMTPQRLSHMSPEDFDHLEALPLVVARCSPETKVQLVDAHQRRNHILAMTGDGVNDAPSIRRADVGIAMGSGSDVAKQAADIVLVDDNFATIVLAIREGRRMFINIRKFVVHLMSTNISEVILLVLGLAFRTASGGSVFPMSPIQILWLNLLTSSPPALALGVEDAPRNIMTNPPRQKSEGVFNKIVIMDSLVMGGILGIVMLAVWVLMIYGVGNGQDDLLDICNESHGGEDDLADKCDLVYRARSVVFASITLCILFLGFECRRPNKPLVRFNPLNNKALNFSALFAIALTVPTFYIPWLNENVFRQRPISWEWGIVFGAFFTYAFALEIFKITKRLVRLEEKHARKRALKKMAAGSGNGKKAAHKGVPPV